MDDWIVIPNWNKFQHYGNRGPAWIKVYLELNSRDDWLSCSCAARGLLVTCWVEYARSRGRLRRSHVARIAGAGFKQAYLDSLNQAGFIEFSASEPAPLTVAPRYPRVREEVEVEPLPTTSVGIPESENLKCKNCGNPIKPRQVCPSCGVNPRAAGNNPRALEQRDKDQQHQQLLDEAHRVAATWNGGDSLHFDETLDELEHQHALKLGSLERDRLWEAAFQHRAPVEEDELF